MEFDPNRPSGDKPRFDDPRSPELWHGWELNIERVKSFEDLQGRAPGMKIVARYGEDRSKRHKTNDYKITNQEEYEQNIGEERNQKAAQDGPFICFFAVEQYTV